jgi:hypothetical protein
MSDPASIQKIRSSHVKNISAEQYAGYDGLIWFDNYTGELRIWDNNVPGGRLIYGNGGGGGSNVTIESNSVVLTNAVNTINFTGTGSNVTNVGNVVTVQVSGLPSQTGQMQKFLQTDGDVASWQYVAGVFGLWINGGTAFNGGNCLVVDGGGA